MSPWSKVRPLSIRLAAPKPFLAQRSLISWLQRPRAPVPSNNLTIADDPIPNDTTYVADSITLEGGALTDSDADADEGSFDGSQIAVALGNIAGGQTRTITFQVTID